MAGRRSGLWATAPLADLSRIRQLEIPDQTKASCRSLYLALTEISLESFHKPFEASRERLAAASHLSVRTVDACLVHLADAGIVKITPRVGKTGRVATSRYRLPTLARLNAPIATGNGHGPMTPDKLAKLVGT